MPKLALKRKIDPAYESIVFRSTNEEYVQLRDDIKRNGQYYPVIVNKSPKEFLQMAALGKEKQVNLPRIGFSQQYLHPGNSTTVIESIWQ